VKKKEYIFAFLLFLIITIIWFWGYNTSYFATPDAHDYAQMGRQISDGNGFSTLQIFPRHVSFLDKIGFLRKENWPNLHRYPLPTICSALLYKITNDIVKAAVLMSGVPFLLSIPVLFLLAFKLTDLKASVLCTIFFASHSLIFESGYNGLSESLAAFLLLLLFLMTFSGRLSIWRCLALGILSGLCYLARTQLIAALPIVLLFIWISEQKKQRIHSIGLFIIGFLLITGPWFARNILTVGKPVFSFVNSRALVLETIHKKSDLQNQLIHTDLEMQLEAPVDTTEIFKKYGPAITKKVFHNILAIFTLKFWSQDFPTEAIFIFFLFAASIYRRHSGNKNYDFYRYGVILLFFFSFLIISLLDHVVRLYIPLIPFIYIAGINEILVLFSNLRFGFLRKFKYIVFCGMLLFGLFKFYNVTMIHKHRPSPISTPEKSSYEFLKQTASRDSIIVSNTSHRIALYVGCRTIRLPVFPADLLKINDSYIPIDFVLINRRMSRNYQYSNYNNFIKSDAFSQKFKFVRTLPDGSLLFKNLEGIN
jgi:4-amino-4-deoxy-L-arabinose transferase-like glycosyltransferase